MKNTNKSKKKGTQVIRQSVLTALLEWMFTDSPCAPKHPAYRLRS